MNIFTFPQQSQSRVHKEFNFLQYPSTHIVHFHKLPIKKRERKKNGQSTQFIHVGIVIEKTTSIASSHCVQRRRRMCTGNNNKPVNHFPLGTITCGSHINRTSNNLSANKRNNNLPAVSTDGLNPLRTPFGENPIIISIKGKV